MAHKKKSFLETRGYKKGMNMLMGIGASVVIIGALFKILHLPGAAIMLTVGLVTEAMLFFVSAFNPLPPDEKHYEWERVFPQLKEEDDPLLIDDEDDEDFDGEEGEKVPPAMPIYGGYGGLAPGGAAGAGLPGAGGSSGMALSGTAQALSEANMDPEIFQKLSESVEGLKRNVDSLAEFTDTSLAANEFNDKLRVASGKIDQLSEGYTSTVETINHFGESISHVRNLQDQIQLVTQNLTSLNGVYEQELADAQKHINAVSKFYGSMSNVMQNLLDTSKDTEQLRHEVSSLARNMHHLNSIYGGMLSAMASAGRSGGNA